MTRFVGRNKELSLIESKVQELIANQGTGGSPPLATVIYIAGEGGIGKTRLLQEVEPSLMRSSLLDIIDVCDFDDRSLSIEDSFALWLMSQINSDSTQKARDEFLILQGMKERVDSSTTLDIQRDKIMSALLSAYKEKPRVLRFDTLEKLSDDLKGKTLFPFIRELRNAVVLLAGRPDPKLGADLDQYFDPERLIQLMLKSFETSVGEEYIHETEKERNLKIPNKLIAPLLKLTDGKPILIDLAIEYLARSVSIDPLLYITDFDTLGEDAQKEQRAQFEEKLVSHIVKLSDRMDRLVLMLSRVSPLSVATIERLLNITRQDASNLFEEAQSYVFIKSLDRKLALDDKFGANSIVLQDVMRELVNLHVWDKVDPNEQRRKRDSRLIYETYEQLDERLHDLQQAQASLEKNAEPWANFVQRNALEQEREMVTEIWVSHIMYADFEFGFGEWSNLIDRVRRGRKYDFSSRLLQLVTEYYEAEQLAPIHVGEYLFARARDHLDNARYPQAEEEFTQLLSGEDHSIQHYRIYNMLGVVNRNLGRFQQALEYQQRSLELLDSNKWWERANIENQIGFLYRLLEDFDRGNLDSAKIHFENVLKLCTNNNKDARNRDLEKPNKILLGGACNNLGYVEGLQGNFARGYQLLNLSIEVFETASRKREISWPETNMGILARDEGRYEYSALLLNRSINRLSLPNDHKELCRAYFHLGWTQWFKAFETRALIDVKLLELAHESLKKSRDIAEEYSYLQEQPGIFHQLATVTWQLGHVTNSSNLKRDGRELNQKALSLCRELNNVRYGIDALVGEMEFDLADFPNDFARLEQTFVQLQHEYEKYSFPLYFGRARRFLGDCAYQNRDFDVALCYYIAGIPEMNSHGGYGPYSIDTELDMLGDKIYELSVETAIEWIDSLEQAWREHTNGYTDLIDWCDAQKMRNQLR